MCLLFNELPKLCECTHCDFILNECRLLKHKFLLSNVKMTLKDAIIVNCTHMVLTKKKIVRVFRILPGTMHVLTSHLNGKSL